MLWLLDTVYHKIYLLLGLSLQRERQVRLESESRTLQIKGKWKMVRSKKRLRKSHIIRTLNSPQVQVTQVEKQLNFCPIKRQSFDQRRGRLGKEVSLLGRQGICGRYRSEPKKCVCILGWSDVCSLSSPGLPTALAAFNVLCTNCKAAPLPCRPCGALSPCIHHKHWLFGTVYLSQNSAFEALSAGMAPVPPKTEKGSRTSHHRCVV